MAKRETHLVEKADPFTDPACNTCKHLVKGTITCKAFKQRIPDDILDGDNPHAIPVPGQKNDTVWTARG